VISLTRTLYVGNLPWATKEQDLQEIFGQYGQVLSARVITDRDSGRSKGFGFIEVDDDEGDRMIQEMNGRNIGERALVVNDAKPRE
jgi:RNA recognition motif-containing protein